MSTTSTSSKTTKKTRLGENYHDENSKVNYSKLNSIKDRFRLFKFSDLKISFSNKSSSDLNRIGSDETNSSFGLSLPSA